MPTRSAGTIVFNHDKSRVLLCKREDFGFFPVNVLPARTINWTRNQVADALAANSPVIERTEILPLFEAMFIRIGHLLRDLRNKYILKHQ